MWESCIPRRSPLDESSLETGSPTVGLAPGRYGRHRDPSGHVPRKTLTVSEASPTMETERGVGPLVAIGALLVVVVAAAVLVVAPGDDHAPREQLHVTQADASEMDGSVIEYDDMTADQRAVFEGAVSDGRESIPPAVDGSVWRTNRGVRYQNRTYHVAVAVP